MVQLVIVILQHDACLLRFSVSTPDLMAIQSSPALIEQSEICTLLHESGLIPSVLGESAGLAIVTLWMVRLLQRTGLIVQLGELIAVMPSISTLVQSESAIRRGRG